MKIEIPDKIVQETIDACIIQQSGSINSSDLRGDQVKRMTNHIGEYVCCILAKELRNRKLLPYVTKY